MTTETAAGGPTPTADGQLNERAKAIGRSGLEWANRKFKQRRLRAIEFEDSEGNPWTVRPLFTISGERRVKSLSLIKHSREREDFRIVDDPKEGITVTHGGPKLLVPIEDALEKLINDLQSLDESEKPEQSHAEAEHIFHG